VSKSWRKRRASVWLVKSRMAQKNKGAALEEAAGELEVAATQKNKKRNADVHQVSHFLKHVPFDMAKLTKAAVNKMDEYPAEM
jgi:hypothetical protein